MKRKNRSWIYPLAIMGVFLMLTNSCKKDDDNNVTPPPPIPPGAVTDIDGNVYTTVTIGTQLWMVENLKTTRYNDGTAIPLVTDNEDWENHTTPAYCWYNNDSSYKNPYGAIYNWYTVHTHKLCPTTWHVPTDAEWDTLVNYLGGDSIAGGKMKETGLTYWWSPNTDATNSSGFTGLPGGSRLGNFHDNGRRGVWWSSRETGYYNAWFRGMYYDDGYVSRHDSYKENGFSVRCIMY